MQKKRSLRFSMIIAGSVAGAAMLAAVPAQAQENPVGAVLGAAAAIAAAPFMWGGHRYCWYEGWNGPGWYWCGYGARRGYGWGGGDGWHGHHYRGHRGGHMGGHHGGHMGGHHMGGHSGGHSGGHHDHH